MKHGKDCHKMEHRVHPDDQGYLHAEDDDAPYSVDGQLYCGRCHYAIDAPDAIVATMTSFDIPSRTRFAVVYREYATDWLLAGYPMLDEACEAQRIINFLKATPRFSRMELSIAKINLLPE